MTQDFVNKVISTMTSRSYDVNKRDHELNLIGIRTNNNVPNSFDDWMIAAWYESNKLHYHIYKITTDPGLFYLNSPINVEGTGIVKPGHYPGCWQKGLHQGKYTALVQRGKITLIRDFDRDSRLDVKSPDLTKLTLRTRTTSLEVISEWFDANGKVQWRETTGKSFGINCHRARDNGKSTIVDKWSAGCQVFSDDVVEFPQLLALVDKHISLYENSFNYTLFEETEL